jgi:hypothetical protein
VDADGLDDDAGPPLVLRRMPLARQHLARAWAGTGSPTATGTWWELVDPAAADHAAPAALAVTSEGPDGAVRVLALGAPDGARPEVLTELVAALVAVLRSHSADVVLVRPRDDAVVPALLEAGFGPAPEVGTYALVL